MIHVIAVITARPGQRAALLDKFRKVMPLVHAEPGCVQYEPIVDLPGATSFQQPAGPDTYIVVERWESVEALRAHSGSAHMRDYNEDAASLIASRAIHVMTPASGG